MNTVYYSADVTSLSVDEVFFAQTPAEAACAQCGALHFCRDAVEELTFEKPFWLGNVVSMTLVVSPRLK